MDTLSHAMIGMAVAGLSGQPASFHNPVYLASVIGAQAPDFDIIAQLRGNFSYIRQHRAYSHSFPGLIMWASLISTILYHVMPTVHWFTLFAWTFAGGLSHILIDFLNTHGAAILWPLRKERKSLHLLNVFDPVLTALMLSPYMCRVAIRYQSIISFLLLIAYVMLRIFLRNLAHTWLRQAFPNETISEITVMPSLKRILFWDFVVVTEKHYYMGKIGALYPVVEMYAKLPKQSHASTLTKMAQKTFLGDFFISFSPFVYFEEEATTNSLRVNIYDLRYILNQEFLHRGTIFFDNNKKPTVSYMHSYGRIMKLPC